MDPRKLMGIESPGDHKVQVTVRDWNAMRRAIWRSAHGWEIVANTALDILVGCDHVEGCPGLDSETEPCLTDRYEEASPTALEVRVERTSPVRSVIAAIVKWFGRRTRAIEVHETPQRTSVLVSRGCPDRELRMSALVILNAARQHAPVDAARPVDEYFAPSREYFSSVLSSLAAAQIEIEELREKIRHTAPVPLEVLPALPA